MKGARDLRATVGGLPPEGPGPMRVTLFSDGLTLAPQDPPRPSWTAPDPWRRGVTFTEDGCCWLDGHPVDLHGRAGPVLDVLLALTPSTALHRIPPEVARSLAADLRTLLDLPAHHPSLPGLRRDGIRASAAAILGTLDAAPSPAPDAPRDLVTALLRRGTGQTDALDETWLAWAEWVLGPNPAYAVEEDRYELTREDVGLLWCGLARCATPDAFPWLRSGLVIFHECRPDGASISAPARDAMRDLLASVRAPSDFSTWQDDIVHILPRVRAAPSLPRAVRQTTAPEPVSLTRSQLDALGAGVDHPDLGHWLEQTTACFPASRRVRALPPAGLASILRRIADEPGAQAREDVLLARLRPIMEDLTFQQRFGRRTIPTPLALALALRLSEHVSHTSDLDAVAATLEALLPAHADTAHEAIAAFDDGAEAPPWWRLPRFAVAYCAGLASPWRVQGHEVHPGTFDTAVLGHTPHPHLRLRLAMIDLLAERAARRDGPVAAQSEMPRDVTCTLHPHPLAGHALVIDGAHWIDGHGRLTAADPTPPWLTATLTADGSVNCARAEVLPVPTVPLEPGDPVVLPDGTEGVLSEVLATSAQVYVVRHGMGRLERVDPDAVAAGHEVVDFGPARIDRLRQAWRRT